MNTKVVLTMVFIFFYCYTHYRSAMPYVTYKSIIITNKKIIKTF